MIAPIQTELTLFRRRRVKLHADALETFLQGNGWMTAEAIANDTGWNDRKIRDLASESDHVISYPGSPGYKLLSDATREEYEHYRNSRKAQARVMIGKVIRTDRIFFRRPTV